jgi:hypothetical protein
MNQDESLSCTRTSGKNVEMKTNRREKKESRAGERKITRGAKRKEGKKPEKKKYMKT